MVAFAYRHYSNGYAPPDDVEELTEEIIKLLLDHNCHRIKTYDPAKASLKTWLTPIVRHETWVFIKKKRTWDSLDETLAEKLMEQPTQELNLISKEQQIAMNKEIAQLSEQNRQLITLIREEFPVAEIAKQLNIKPESAHRMKYEIIQKLRVKLNKNGGGQFSCQSSQQEK